MKVYSELVMVGASLSFGIFPNLENVDKSALVPKAVALLFEGSAQ